MILVVAVLLAAVDYWYITAPVAGVAIGVAFLLRYQRRRRDLAAAEALRRRNLAEETALRELLSSMPTPPPPPPPALALREDEPLEERKETMVRRMSAFNEQVLAFLDRYGKNPDEWRARWRDDELPGLVGAWEALTPEFIAIGEAIIQDETLRAHPQIEDLWVGDVVKYFDLDWSVQT